MLILIYLQKCFTKSTIIELFKLNLFGLNLNLPKIKCFLKLFTLNESKILKKTQLKL